MSSSFAKSLPARCSFIFGNRKKSNDARSRLYGGCSKMSQWNCSCSKACVCRAVCRRALSCNRTIPRESLPLQRFWIAQRRGSWPDWIIRWPCQGITSDLMSKETTSMWNGRKRYVPKLVYSVSVLLLLLLLLLKNILVWQNVLYFLDGLHNMMVILKHIHSATLQVKNLCWAWIWMIDLQL